MICVSNSGGLWIHNPRCFLLTHSARRTSAPQPLLVVHSRVPPKRRVQRRRPGRSRQPPALEHQPRPRCPPPVDRDPQVEASLPSRRQGRWPRRLRTSSRRIPRGGGSPPPRGAGEGSGQCARLPGLPLPALPRARLRGPRPPPRVLAPCPARSPQPRGQAGGGRAKVGAFTPRLGRP